MGSLEYKADWEEAKQRYEAWWRREGMDRPLLWVTAPRDKLPGEPPPPPPDDLEARWTDLDYLAAVNDYNLRRTYFGAEAFPVWSAGYPGHVSIPSFYGCPFTLAEDTGWHSPILKGEKLDVSGLKLNRNGRWWRFGDAMLHRARQEASGKSIPAMGAIFGCGDTLAMLRGNYRLMYDLMDDAAGVREAELDLMNDWFEVFDHQTGLLTDGGGEYATWFPIWALGKFYAVQCDVSYGISPRSFRECFVPALEKWTDYLDHAIYHLDGVGAFHLVEELCKIDGVEAVQVLPGAGRPGPLEFINVLRTIQRMGIGLHISISQCEIPRALSQLSSRGLMIHTSASSETEARQVIEEASRLSVDRG
ncbi:MAG: hypothetical protein ACYTF6_02995 [Planctomycetota bacterium]